MKKIIFCMLISLMFLGISVDTGKADTPPVTVTIGLKGLKHELSLPINMDVTVQNEGEDDIITSHGFKVRDFFLDLTFIIDGKGITADAKTAEGPRGEPLMPPMITVEDQGETQILQAEPVEILEGTLNPPAFITNYDPPFNVHDHYTLTKAGRYEVEAKIPIRVYPGITHTIEDENGVLVDHAELETALFEDFITTSVPLILVDDADGDGYYTEPFGTIHPDEADCEDRLLGADGIVSIDDGANINPGKTEIHGNGIDDDCDPTTPDVISIVDGTINIEADLHTVGSGQHPGSTKDPIADMTIRAYDKHSYCVSNFGVSWHNYESIWNSSGCDGVPFGETDADGKVSLQVPPGDYFVIGFYDTDTYIGVSAGGVGAGTTTDKYLQVIVKSDGKKVPAKYTKKTGSELLIIEPEYVEWDGTQELYPFIFESLGDWDVTTSVSPPEGFVTDTGSLTEEVYTELEAVQFTITDIGSEWVDTGVTHDLEHKGKKEKVKSKIGVRLSKKLAKKKGLSRFGRDKKRNKPK